MQINFSINCFLQYAITGPCPANMEGKVKYKKNKKRVKFTFSADNPDATFKCQLDDQDPEPCKYCIAIIGAECTCMYIE